MQAWGVWLLLGFSLTAAVDWDVETPLDTYVQGDDGYFSWEILASYRYNRSCTLHVVNMTSQKWMDETYVDRPIWWHIMGVAVPDEANITYPDAGFLIIGGGDNDLDDEAPGPGDALNLATCTAALDVGTVGAYINQIPNQPLYFLNDPTNERRTEDEIIAWTWRTYVDDPSPNPDPTVIARFPMTKAVKRGLDTINQVAAAEHTHTPNVTRFMPMGGSKRGWTTWSLAATDRRVFCQAPLVFSMLKMNETLMAHFRSLNGWSFAFEPYYTENLTAEFYNSKMWDGLWHEDMWNYRERFTFPLLQQVSTGDEFFLLQDSHQWWDDIPGPKWTVMYENAEHSMFPHYNDIYSTLTGWYMALLAGDRLPDVTWELGQTATGGFIDYYFDADFPPDQITAFRAVTLQNDTIRDYRLAHLRPDGDVGIHPVIWRESNVTVSEVAPGHWRAETDVVEDEWVGLVVRGIWTHQSTGKELFFTSETNIIPDTFPVEPCLDANACYSKLV